MTDADKAEAARDAIYALLTTSRNDHDGAVASLNNSDDIGMRHHTKRIFDSLRLVHAQLKELERLSDLVTTQAAKSG